MPTTARATPARCEYLRLRAAGVSQRAALVLAEPAARALNAARMRTVRELQGRQVDTPT